MEVPHLTEQLPVTTDARKRMVRRLMPVGSRWRREGGMPLVPRIDLAHDATNHTYVPVSTPRAELRTVIAHKGEMITVKTDDGEESDLSYVALSVTEEDDGNTVVFTPRKGQPLKYRRIEDAEGSDRVRRIAD